MKPINIQITPQELDFICARLVAGKMNYSVARSVGAMIDKLVSQANDASLNPPVTGPLDTHVPEKAEEPKNG